MVAAAGVFTISPSATSGGKSSLKIIEHALYILLLLPDFRVISDTDPYSQLSENTACCLSRRMCAAQKLRIFKWSCPHHGQCTSFHTKLKTDTMPYNSYPSKLSPV